MSRAEQKTVAAKMAKAPRLTLREFFEWLAHGTPDEMHGADSASELRIEVDQKLRQLAKADAALVQPCLDAWLTARATTDAAKDIEWAAEERVRALAFGFGVAVES